VMAALAGALATRLAAEVWPAMGVTWLAASGIAWWLAWGAWGWRAIPALLRHATRPGG